MICKNCKKEYDEEVYPKWHCKDMVQHCSEQCIPSIKSSPIEIVIKSDILDLSNVEEDNSKINHQFRPKTFDEYIGQDIAKERVNNYIHGCKKFNEIFPHTFLSAPAGCGKTVFANILANTLGKKMTKCTGGDLKNEQTLVNKIVECNGNVLFIDEAHKINDKVGTFMLPILEERLIQGKKIKPFICVVATTHKGTLSEKLSAFVQRFLPIELENYNEKELVKILKQFHNKTYNNISVSESIFMEIAKNCKFTPRIAIRFLREYAYIENLDKVKRDNQIVKNGLTKTDFKVLNYLNDHGGVGKNTLAKYLKMEPKTYEFEAEPFLIFKELITVGSRRNLTEKGKQLLKEIS